MGKPWPHDTMEKLREAGYQYQERGRCMAPNCKVVIFWFITPNKKWMPMEIVAPATAEIETEVTKFQPHWASCPESRNFHRSWI